MSNTLEFYNLIENWILDQFIESNKENLFVGINAPQGAGKTTLTQHLVSEFHKKGYRSAAVSIDDFYLSRAEQVALAKKYDSNPYLQQRGYPGTHDIKLGSDTLSEIRNAKGPLKIPRYDKSAHSGQGDRCPEEKWDSLQTPVQILLLEGWMLGFRPPLTPETVDNNWNVIDRFLLDYKSWTDQLDAFIYLQAFDCKYVLEWRLEAEQNMRKSGKTGMSDEEIQTYARKFIPAYERYSQSLFVSQWQIPCLNFTLGRNRLPLN